MAQRFGASTVNNSAPVNELSVVSGYVSERKPLPTTFSEPLWVIVPGYSIETPYLCRKWRAINGKTLPSAGASVLVAFDDNGVPTVIDWDGEYTL